MYSFIPAYASFIEELHGIMICYEQIMKLCKHHGLSWEVKKIYIYKYCLQESDDKQYSHEKSRELYTCTLVRKLNYRIRRMMQITSSDIQESTFGIMKDMKSPNKLHGITSFLLTIPLHTKISNLDLAQTFHVKQRLERVKVKDVRDWEGKNLKQNLVTIRRQRFSFLNESIGTSN